MDWNYIAAMEKAISKKYGDNAIINPKSNWDESKEKEYFIQEKKLRDRINDIEESSSDDKGGFFVNKNIDTNRICDICNIYSFKIEDDIYMNKYDCCNNCFIIYVEGREDRWEDGWRP